MRATNPHIKYVKGEIYGYGLVTFGPKSATATVRAVESIKRADTPIATAHRFAIEAGKPGVVPA